MSTKKAIKKEVVAAPAVEKVAETVVAVETVDIKVTGAKDVTSPSTNFDALDFEAEKDVTVAEDLTKKDFEEESTNSFTEGDFEEERAMGTAADETYTQVDFEEEEVSSGAEAPGPVISGENPEFVFSEEKLKAYLASYKEQDKVMQVSRGGNFVSTKDHTIYVPITLFK